MTRVNDALCLPASGLTPSSMVEDRTTYPMYMFV